MSETNKKANLLILEITDSINSFNFGIGAQLVQLRQLLPLYSSRLCAAEMDFYKQNFGNVKNVLNNIRNEIICDIPEYGEGGM